MIDLNKCRTEYHIIVPAYPLDSTAEERKVMRLKLMRGIWKFEDYHHCIVCEPEFNNQSNMTVYKNNEPTLEYLLKIKKG